MKLNTENINCFIYETDELLIELLGGVRVEGLDRMRVTMKVSIVNRKYPQYTSELADLAIRHNLDLYNDTQVDKFVRRVAEKQEVGSIVLTKAIAEITSKLEVYRLTQLSKQELQPARQLAEQEREEAINLSIKRVVFFMLKTHVVKLNTENANCFSYATDELLIELLGGVRVEGLDRMRVTMKVSVVNRKYPQYISGLADLAT